MIIDAHTHTFPDKIAEKALHRLAVISGITPATNGTVTGTMSYMKDVNVDKFINLNIATSPTHQQTINTTAADNNSKYTQMISTGSVHPDNEDAVKELTRIKNLNIKAIKLHPDYQEFFINEERLYPIYHACSDLDIPIIFHAGWDCYSPDLIHAAPESSAIVAKKFPKLKMILAHFGGLKMWNDVIEYLAGLENVYFDTAMAATYMNDIDITMKIINKHPINNIFMGSDCPWESPADSIKFIEKLPLSDDSKEKILGLNAAKFFDVV